MTDGKMDFDEVKEISFFMHVDLFSQYTFIQNKARNIGSHFVVPKVRKRIEFTWKEKAGFVWVIILLFFWLFYFNVSESFFVQICEQIIFRVYFDNNFLFCYSN